MMNFFCCDIVLGGWTQSGMDVPKVMGMYLTFRCAVQDPCHSHDIHASPRRASHATDVSPPCTYIMYVHSHPPRRSSIPCHPLQWLMLGPASRATHCIRCDAVKKAA